MRQHTLRCRKYQDSNIPRRQVPLSPFLELVNPRRKPGSHSTAVVHTTQELDLELSSSAVIHELELADVAIFLQNSQHMAHEFGGRIDYALVFVPPFIVEDR